MPVTPGLNGRALLSPRSAFTTYLASLQSSGLRVVLDDLRTDVFNFGGEEQAWTVSRDSRWTGGTETIWEGWGDERDERDESMGGFEMLVSGKELKIVGRAPSASDATFSYAIDQGDREKIAFASFSSSSSPLTSNSTTSTFVYTTWASIPLPEDSKPHRVFILGLPLGTSIDYAVVEVHESVPVGTELAVLDDGDGLIEYKSGWDGIGRDDAAGEVEAYGRGIHAAREVGSEAEIHFIGSSISLFTIFPPSSSLTASYTLDRGMPQTRTYSSVDETLVVSNYLLFTSAGLSSSLHTLTVKLIENPGNSSFSLDYVTYTPAFTSLQALASSGGDPAKYSPAPTSGKTGGGQKTTMSPGTMAGTIVAVILVIIALISCFCCRGKRYFVKRAWRNWKKGSSRSGKESKTAVNEKSLATYDKSRSSPDWAFRNPDLSQNDSRTSLEMDLDLDLSPRMRERRHQERDRARSRNDTRRSRDANGGTETRMSRKSRSRTRAASRTGTPPAVQTGEWDTERRRTNERSRSRSVSRTDTPPVVSDGSSSSSHQGEPASNSNKRTRVAISEESSTDPQSPSNLALLSEKALGKRPARDYVYHSQSNAFHAQVGPSDSSSKPSPQAAGAPSIPLLTPFTALQPTTSSFPQPSPDEETEEQELQAGAITPFVVAAPIITPFTVIEPTSTSVSKLKKEKEENIRRFEEEVYRGGEQREADHADWDNEEGGIKPFRAMRPTEGAGSSRKAKEPLSARTSPTSPSPHHATSHYRPNIQPSHLTLREQLSALIAETELQHERGETPSTERLEEISRLGRKIEEEVRKIEERRVGGGKLPPAYEDSEGGYGDGERIGIAL